VVIAIYRLRPIQLLGVFVNSAVSWDSHVIYMLQKVTKRMYCIIRPPGTLVPEGLMFYL